MRLNCGEGNDVCLAGRTSRNAARIARDIGNGAVCRAFLRSVLLWMIDPQRMITDRHY